jgi:hypothetical protein
LFLNGGLLIHDLLGLILKHHIPDMVLSA